MNVGALNKDLNGPTRITQNWQLSKGRNLLLALVWRRPSLCLLSVGFQWDPGQQRHHLHARLCFSISVVSLGQTETERLPRMRKATGTRDATKAGRSADTLPLLKWDGALPDGKERGCQNSSVLPPGGIPSVGRGGSARRVPRGGEAARRAGPLRGCN